MRTCPAAQLLYSMGVFMPSHPPGRIRVRVRVRVGIGVGGQMGVGMRIRVGIGMGVGMKKLFGCGFVPSAERGGWLRE